MPQLPLLIFPQGYTATPRPRSGRGSLPIIPSRDIQSTRVKTKIDSISDDLQQRKTLLSSQFSDIESELVLVIETVGLIADFQKALSISNGLEWLSEWDIDIEPDEYFYDEKNDSKQLKGRLFLSMSNENGLNELLSLWESWKNNISLPYGKGKWKDVFSQIKDIRPWGANEQIEDTGIKDAWIKELEEESDEPIKFEMELFYRKSEKKRSKNENILRQIIEKMGGQTLSVFSHISEIHFHAVKVELPRNQIREILHKVDNSVIDIALLNFSNIMYFRSAGQAISTMSTESEESEPITTPLDIDGDPIVAIFDGAPLTEHQLLQNRIYLDDPNDLTSEYQPGERKHGTAMASLVIHGELDSTTEVPLSRPIYFHPIMQIDPTARGFGVHVEYIPEDIFLEDRIYRAVKRMFEGEGTVAAQAPYIKIINLSIGDFTRPFSHTLSPLAKLLDYLSWKYKVLFCISAGNISMDYDFPLSETQYNLLSQDEQIALLLKTIHNTSNTRSIISPAESINSLTIGATHNDESTYILRNRVDIQASFPLPSSINRIGHGFRHSIKPEIFFPGGRQLYTPPPINGHPWRLNPSISSPGQKIAVDDNASITSISYTRGTSNATALATRTGAKVYDMVKAMQTEYPHQIDDSQIALIIKTLLVHGATKEQWFQLYEESLKNSTNSRIFKSLVSKYIGYGEADVSKSLFCTEQRATIIGVGKIKDGEGIEYKFPLPPSLADTNEWRKLTITLSWFSPMNFNHRDLRKAQLYFTPPLDAQQPLGLKRMENEYRQVKRGTVQHETLESKKVSHYQDGDNLVILLQCHADATQHLDDEIDYSLAVTLEVKENILVPLPIYNEVRTRIQTQIQV